MKITRIILLTILVLEAACFIYIQTNLIIVNQVEIENPALARILSHTNTVQISDLHIKSFGYREKSLIEKIVEINPDLLIITGDFVTSDEGIKPCLEVMAKLSENRKVIAVLGNNDHEHNKIKLNTVLLTEGLKKLGVNILQNESLKLSFSDKEKGIANTLYIVGLDDNFLYYDNIYKALTNVPDNADKILLAHSPNIVEKIDIDKFLLVLSGHTHGGQIVIPFIGAIYTNSMKNTNNTFVSGLYHFKSVLLYVNRGIGNSLLPIRLFCRPEITLFKFKG
jgi:hypothetical protein